MPREFCLATPTPVRLDDVLLAGLDVDVSLEVRTVFAGAAIQLADVEGRAVITVEPSRQLADPVDARRVAPDMTGLPDPLWWTEGCVPWGAVGDDGVLVVRLLAERLSGALVLADGS